MFKRISIIALLLLGAHLSLTALVPAAAGQGPPPWWVGGGVLWPFFADTATLLPAGGIRDVFTPILGITASRFRGLVVAGVVASIVVQVVWISGWAVLPLAVDAALLWLVLGRRVAAGGARKRAAVPAGDAR
jgi:hypothetical protein